MFKFIAAIAIAASIGTVQAQHGHYATGTLPHYRHHHHHHHHHGHNAQVLGALAIGGLVGYAISRPAQVIVEQPVYIERSKPVYVSPQTVYIERNDTVCSQWREIQYSNGQIVRERICNQ